MKKLIKLIVLLVVLAGLVVGYVFLSKHMAKKEAAENAQPEVDTTVTVFTLDSSKVSAIDYVFDGESISLKKADGKWQWADDADFPLDETYPEDMLSVLTSVIADRLIAENLDNEAEFGMDEPNMSVKYSTSDGTEYTYVIGDYNSVSEGYYVKVGTQDKIYMIKDSSGSSVIAPFMYYKLEMIKADSIPEPEAERITDVEYVMDGKNYLLTTKSEGADFYTEPYTYFYVGGDGVKIASDGQAAGELMSAVSSLALGNAVAFKPDAEALANYGLGENSAVALKVVYEEDVTSEGTDTTVNVTKSEDYSLKIGKTTDEEGKVKCYAMLDGSEVVYELDGGEDFFAAISVDFESKLVCPVLADKTLSFKAVIDSKEYVYNMADTESNENIMKVFNAVTALVMQGETENEKGEAVAKFVFSNGNGDLELNIFKLDETNCIAAFDKRDGMLVSVEKVNNIINIIQG